MDIGKKRRGPLLAAGLICGLLMVSGCTSTGNIGLLSDSETETDLGPHDSHKFHRVGKQITGTA